MTTVVTPIVTTAVLFLDCTSVSLTVNKPAVALTPEPCLNNPSFTHVAEKEKPKSNTTRNGCDTRRTRIKTNHS